MDANALTRQVEGRPAPMPLLAVQAFANTIDVEEGVDRLDSLDSWQRWLEESGLLASGVRVREEHLGEARALRSLLRELLAKNTARDDGGRATGGIADRLGIREVALTGTEDGALGLELAPAKDAGTLSTQLVGIVYEAQLTGAWSRLKLCENEECAWAFYDSSRNRSGSWCRMGLCGNRLKNRAYRARQRTRRSRSA